MDPELMLQADAMRLSLAHSFVWAALWCYAVAFVAYLAHLFVQKVRAVRGIASTGRSSGRCSVAVM